MSEPAVPVSPDPNVYADATTIYEDGRLVPIKIADVLGNEVACRQLINSLNISYRDTEKYRKDNQRLEVRQARIDAEPKVPFAIVNVAGAVLIGLGTNYLASAHPPFGAWGIVGTGAILTVVSALQLSRKER